MAGMRVLVVEDDTLLAHTISRNLSVRGYSVRSAISVESATAALRQEVPDLVLLDIDLPDGSGWEIARQLRSELPATAIVVMSALRPNARLAAELRIEGVLEKPFPMESLLRLIAFCCGSQAGEEDTSAEGTT